MKISTAIKVKSSN